MLFYTKYGCDSLGYEELIVDSEDVEEATEYAHDSAISYRESYEGIHGVLDFKQYCEENAYDLEEDYEEAYDEYCDMVENELDYLVEIYDENNIVHVSALEEQGEPFSI